MRKTWVNGYVVSLSGGADSSAVATLVYYMLKFAKEQLSPEELQAKLPHLDTDNLELGDVLTCVYQSTRNSSETTRDAAETLAKSIGSSYMELDVDVLVESYKEVVGKGLNKDWNWDEDDITLQNIQARSRAPSVWMISNTKNQILLATSNRSEAAVGYATMDGDTCGGLSPIAGIDKAFLRQWLCHVEMEVALCKVNEQQPTAELRPASEGQTDEGDLMPYSVLDFIEDLAIRDKKGPKDVFAFVKAKFDQDDNVTFAQIEKFFQLWCRNQWKRERYAPSFHVDDKNLDPRSWCRFPILSGGFKLELRELKESIKENN
jgi:NAD+ synthase (glutamine-hydrolysing)